MPLRFDEFELDDVGLELRRDGVSIKADAVVLRLLYQLACRPGQLVTKEQLIARVWEGRAVSENVITVAVARLRKTLGHAKGAREFVVSVHGRGYRFVRAVDDTPAGAPPSRPALVLRGLPFVGRERVLDRLRLAMADLRRGHGSMCLLIGEAGIGKTSAAEVAEAEAAAAGFIVAWGHCRESGDTPPLAPFIRIVRDALERPAIDPTAPRLAAAVDELRRGLPELGPIALAATGQGDEAPAAGGDPPAHRLFDAAVRVLARIGDQVPCVLVLDDLHRADSATLELLRYFVDEIARTRVLVVGTLRKAVTLEAPASRHLAYVLGHRNATRLELDRLDESEVGAYVSAVLGDHDAALARSVYAKSEGNPFFMVEFARLLQGSRDARASFPSMSDAAFDLIRQRLSAMEPGARTVVSTAAVLGNPFDLRLLHDVSGVPTDDLMASLDQAVATGVLACVEDSTTTFRFTHDLLRAVLHDDLDKTTRRMLHARAVDALERRAALAGSVPAADLAYHAHSALPEGEPRRAVRHCIDAGTAAAARRAYGDAVRYSRHAREALELVPQPSPRLRVELMLRHALFARTCASPDFEPTVHEAIRVARSVGAPSALARAALMLDLHPGFPAFAGARAALEGAREALSPGDQELPAVLGRLVTCAPTSYDVVRASSDLARAVELAEKADALIAIYTVRSAALYLQGGPRHEEVAAACLRDLEALCESAPGTLAVAPVLLEIHRAIAASQRGRESVAAAAIERAAVSCRELGHHELGWHLERFRLLSRVNAGQRDAVAAALREHHRRAERESLMGTDVFVAYDEAVTLGSGSGREARAGTAFGTSSARALVPGPDDLPSIWSLKVRALAAAGRHDEARRALHRVAPGGLERLPCDRDYLGTLGALTRAALVLDEPAYLAVLEALLRPYARYVAIHVSFFSEGPVSGLLGTLAAGRRRRAGGAP